MSSRIETLVMPIASVENGAAETNLIKSDPKNLLFTLKDIRANARRVEREAITSGSADARLLKVAVSDWEQLCALAEQFLTDAMKDLEVGCWYCEGLIRLSGFQGLAEGLELLARLVEDFWDHGLTPQEDEDGVETRLAPLAGLLGRGVAGSLAQPIKLIALSDGQQVEGAALWTLEIAQTPQRSETVEARESRNQKLEALIQSVIRSSPTFLRALRRDLETSLQNLDQLKMAVDAKSGQTGFGGELAQSLRSITTLLDDRVGALFAPVAESETASGSPAETGAEGVAPGGPNAVAPLHQTRDQALQQLLELSDYFERTEPQSLVASGIREVVRRARLSVADLMHELLPVPSQREEFFLRAGIKTGSE